MSRLPCRPFDAARDGLSIGEAAAFALLERADASPRPGDRCSLGTGESSDAYHMSAPHPEGRGARAAMRAGARRARRSPRPTSTTSTSTAPARRATTRPEARAVAAARRRDVPGSSTKGATGHTLGAAGALEAVICALALRHELHARRASTHRTRIRRCQVNYLRENRAHRCTRVMSNSFGFGGSNCSLIFGRAPGERMSRCRACIDGVGLLGPGLRRLERGQRRPARRARPSSAAARVLPPPECLPPAERRRTGTIVSWRSRSASRRCAQARAPMPRGCRRCSPPRAATARTATRSARRSPAERLISPTRFHNSVHNAAAGYWGIATGATPAANALCADDASFGAGLLEALRSWRSSAPRCC